MDLTKIILAASFLISSIGCKDKKAVEILTDKTFYSGISGEVAVVNFCNSSYPNCAQSIADFNLLANKYNGKADFGYYDCSSGKICGRYGIRYQSTYIIFKNGHQVIMYDELTAEGLEAAIE